MTSLRRLSVLLVLPLLALTAACGDDTTTTPKAESSQCTYTETGTAARKVDLPPGNPPKDLPSEVTISTNQGDINVSLDVDKAPCAANSFVSLAKQKFFDKTPCHRLTVAEVGGLSVLQCGDPTGTGTGGPGYQFDEELVDQDPRLQPCLGQASPDSGKEFCTYAAGTVAMAKSPQPGTTGSQFFLVYKDSILDAAYTVVGRMSAAGLKVVQQVAAAGATAPDQNGTTAPKQAVQITSVK